MTGLAERTDAHGGPNRSDGQPPAWFCAALDDARAAYGRIVATRDEAALDAFALAMERITDRRPHLAPRAGRAMEGMRTVAMMSLGDLAALEHCLTVEAELEAMVP